MALHKGLYYYFHVIHFCFLFAFLFKKLKNLPLFLKKKLGYLVSEIFPIGVFLQCATDQMFIEVLLFKETSPGDPALKNFCLRA